MTGQSQHFMGSSERRKGWRQAEILHFMLYVNVGPDLSRDSPKYTDKGFLASRDVISASGPLATGLLQITSSLEGPHTQMHIHGQDCGP